jgi:magnesium-transporting ATPase (P-type)
MGLGYGIVAGIAIPVLCNISFMTFLQLFKRSTITSEDKLYTRKLKKLSNTHFWRWFMLYAVSIVGFWLGTWSFMRYIIIQESYGGFAPLIYEICFTGGYIVITTLFGVLQSMKFNNGLKKIKTLTYARGK